MVVQTPEQTREQTNPYFLQEYLIVLHPDLQVHQTTPFI